MAEPAGGDEPPLCVSFLELPERFGRFRCLREPVSSGGRSPESFGINHAHRRMQPKITYNDAWESIPLACADEVIEFFDRELQPNHPLRSFKLFPVAKCWRRHKYLVEEEDPTDTLWVLDLQRRMRVRDKTYYYFKRIETQEELDVMLRADYEAWVQYMRDAGAWHGD